MSTLPFGVANIQIEQNDPESNDTTVEMSFYPSYFQRTITEDSAVSSGDEEEMFEVNNQQISSWAGPSEAPLIERISERLDGWQARIQTSAIVLLAFWFFRLQNPKRIIGNKQHIACGILATLVLIGAFTMFTTVTTDYGDASIRDLGLERDDNPPASTLWGTHKMVDETEEIEVTTQWAPAALWWVSIPIILLSGLIATSHLVEFSPLAENTPKPSWGEGSEGNTPPDWLVKGATNTTYISLIVLSILLLSTLLLSWFSITQTYQIEQEDPPATSHEFSWSITPWFIWQTNSSVFAEDDEADATTTRGYELLSEDPYLSHVTTQTAQARWGVIAATLTAIGTISIAFFQPFSKIMGGSRKGWLLIGIAASILIIGGTINAYEDGIGIAAREDLGPLVPDMGISTSLYATQSPFGIASGEFSIGTGNSTQGGYMETTWGPGIGAKSADLFIPIAVFTLSLIAIPQIALLLERRDEEELGWSDLLGLEHWQNWPAIGSVTLLLILATLGSGVANLLVDPTLGSASNQKLFEINTGYNWGNNQSDWITVDDGQTASYEFSPADEGVGNMTNLEIAFYCDEGAQGAFSDLNDELTLEVIPPAEFVAGQSSGWSFDLTVGNDCGNWYNFYANWTNVNEPPESTKRWGANAEEIYSMFGDPTGSGFWQFKVTAHTNGGVTPVVDDDANLAFMVQVSSYGWEITVEESET